MPQYGPVRRWFYTWTEPTYAATALYRFTQYLYSIRVPVLGTAARLYGHLLRVWMRAVSGVDLAPSVQCGPGLYIGHPGGIHVHEDVEIGANCSLNHEVTIGIGGQGKRRGVPKIGDCVFISAGAKIYGKIEIGDHVMIGPNAVVSRSVPRCSVAGGVPARVVARTTEDAVNKLIFGQDYAAREAETGRGASSAGEPYPAVAMNRAQGAGTDIR